MAHIGADECLRDVFASGDMRILTTRPSCLTQRILLEGWI